MDAPKDFTLDEDSYRDDIMGDDYGDDEKGGKGGDVKKEVDAPKVQKTESSFKLESDRLGSEAGKAAAVVSTEVVKTEEKKDLPVNFISISTLLFPKQYQIKR